MENIKITIERSIKDLIENNLNCLNQHNSVYSPIVLTTAQDTILRVIEDENNVIIRKHRSVGVSTLINAIIACRLISNDKWNITYVNVNYNCIGINLKNIVRYVDILIKKYDLDIEIKFSSNEIKLSNGNSLIMINKAFEINNHDICHSNWVIFDEAALNKNAIEVYNMIYHYYDINKTTIISTQNGIDDLFFPIYFLGKKAGFTSIDARWQATEYIDKSDIIRYQKTLNTVGFEREFGDSFIIHDPYKIDAVKLINNIKNYLVKDEIISLLDLNKLNGIINIQ